MRCNIEVDDLASVMQQNYEAVQVAEGQCRNGEKVDGGNLLCMIGEKCSMKGAVKRKFFSQSGGQVFFPDSQLRDTGSN